ncbi:MAG: magnesium transporter CorA family protein [Gaiellales bacterium]
MLQRLDLGASPAVMAPLAEADLAAVLGGTAPLAWLDCADPSDAELAALGRAAGWSDALTAAVHRPEGRQRFVRLGDWAVVQVGAPRGDGTGCMVLSGTTAITVRYDWPVDFAEAAAEVQGWVDLPQAGAMAVACVLLSRIVEVYEDAAGDLEDRLVDQESGVLEASQDRDPLPALRETATLRTHVGDLRRRANRLREVIGMAIRQELVDRRHGEAVDLELRDVYDHLLRVHDDLDAYGERLIALQDSRLSLVAYRQNDITKKISGWGAVLLVPTITTGWYGQNFQHLWLLDSYWGGFFAAAVALVGMVSLALVLRKADWL